MTSRRIKAVVMCHNTPDSTEELFDRLSSCFDVDVYDSGSDEDRRPRCKAERFGNLYWTGCWSEAMARNRDEEFLWVLGGDVGLLNEPAEYLEAILSMRGHNVACWSPAVKGRCRDFMKADKAAGRVLSVYHVEGQAMAVSGCMMRTIGWEFPKGNRLGWGVDVWMCWKAWISGMRNVLDGRVALSHPAGTGYDEREAMLEANAYLEREIGRCWPVDARMTPAHEVFEANVREFTR